MRRTSPSPLPPPSLLFIFPQQFELILDVAFSASSARWDASGGAASVRRALRVMDAGGAC